MEAIKDESDLSALAQWRQGDCSLELKSSVVADLPAESDQAFSPYTDEAEGIVVLSQTCDVVRADDPLGPVIVAPLTKVTDELWKATKRGMRPRYATVPALAADEIVADLGRAFTITKQLLANLRRTPGFTDEVDAGRFALAIERMFGRFAFPDGFNETVRRLRDRIFRTHSNPHSKTGAVYKSVREIRVKAAPSWDHPDAEIAFIFVLEDDLKPDVQDIRSELDSEVTRMTLPGNLRWSNPRFVIDSLDSLSARDIIESQPLDLQIVSGPS